MDVTNPGLVNVADQVVGNPSVAVSSLAVPKNDDVLVPAADEGFPPGENVSLAIDASNTVGPTPSSVLAGDDSPAVSSQVTSQIPGTAPDFAPTPQVNLVDTVTQQQIPGVNTTEIVVGPNSNIQTNQNDESERHYTVTSVADADTGAPVVDPSVPITGTFNAILDAGGGNLTVVSPVAFSPSVVDGVVVNVASTSGPSYNLNGIISSVTSLAGTVSAVSPSTGGKVTVSSPTSLPAGLVDGRSVTLATTVSGYNGVKTVSGVTNVSGGFVGVASASGGTKITVFSTSPVPAALVPGKHVTLQGGAYVGTFLLDSLGTPLSGTYDTVSDNGSGGITVHSPNPLPVGLTGDQLVTLAGAVYAGTFTVLGVDSGAQTFDLAVAFTATDAGTWAQAANYAFVLDVTYTTTDAGSWTCRTFDVTATFSTTATGTWTSCSFNVPGAYAGTAAGTWTYTPVAYFTTRYRLGVSPADLTSFGINLAGRELVFDYYKIVLGIKIAIPNGGAVRLIQSYDAGSLVISRSDPEDDTVPVMTSPQVGDGFTLFVQREGSEIFTDGSGAAAEVTIAPPPPVFVADPAQALQSQGNVDVTVGPQPGQVLITSGVVVPTARNVYVADQSTSVGLPKNVFV